MSSLITNDRLDVICRFVKETALLNSGHTFMAELGVYMGGSARTILEALSDDERILLLYDTFRGLPHDGGNHKMGEFSASVGQVQRTLGPHMDRTLLFPGVFPESVMESEYYEFSFVHVDADLYESTRDAIAFFWPRMVGGGIMIFDDVDWPDCPGVNRALEESGMMKLINKFALHQGVIRKS